MDHDSSSFAWTQPADPFRPADGGACKPQTLVVAVASRGGKSYVVLSTTRWAVEPGDIDGFADRLRWCAAQCPEREEEPEPEPEPPPRPRSWRPDPVLDRMAFVAQAVPYAVFLGSVVAIGVGHQTTYLEALVSCGAAVLSVCVFCAIRHRQWRRRP